MWFAGYSDIICILSDICYWFQLLYLMSIIDSDYSIWWNILKYPAGSRIIVSDENSIFANI